MLQSPMSLRGGLGVTTVSIIGHYRGASCDVSEG